MTAHEWLQVPQFGPQDVPPFDFHLHTSWTDGSADVRTMHAAASQAGLRAVLFSEHARKTSGDWFGRFADEVRSLKGGASAYVGVETKVEDFDGSLDVTEAIVSACDLVMASVHRFPGEKGVVRGFEDVQKSEAVDTEFRLALGILKNPRVDILAHPFGMCYRRFGVVPPDDLMRELIRAAAGSTAAFEINPHYHPDPWRLVTWCRQAGAKVSLGSNAHAPAEAGRVTRVLSQQEAPWAGLAS